MPRLREIALQFGPSSRHRGGMHYAEGDIILEREPKGRVGSDEAHTFVWALVEFPDDMPPIGAYLDLQERPLAKARFNAIRAIERLFPTFDFSRARDSADMYQPFVTLIRQPAGDFLFAYFRDRCAPKGGV